MNEQSGKKILRRAGQLLDDPDEASRDAGIPGRPEEAILDSKRVRVRDSFHAKKRILQWGNAAPATDNRDDSSDQNVIGETAGEVVEEKNKVVRH